MYIRQAQLFSNNEIDKEVATKITTNNWLVYDDPNSILWNKFHATSDIFLWKYLSSGLKIPIDKDLTPISVIQIQPSDNVYDYVSTHALLPNAEIICGENIQSLCDVVIGSTQKLRGNPNNLIFSKKLVDINKIHVLDAYKTIFVFTDNLPEFYQRFANQLSDKIIVTHNSDFEIIPAYKPFLTNIKHQFSQNCLIKHPNLTAIPIGIENRQWFDHDCFHRVRTNTNIKKDKLIYFNFSLKTHSSRRKCYDILKSKLPWNDQRSKEEYFIELKRHRYAICPRGNGLDTHRLWECIYLDVIPIMVRSDDVHIEGLPIIWLDKWEDFDENNLTEMFPPLSVPCLSKILTQSCASKASVYQGRDAGGEP
jgi:hypothetical protein